MLKFIFQEHTFSIAQDFSSRCPFYLFTNPPGFGTCCFSKKDATPIGAIKNEQFSVVIYCILVRVILDFNLFVQNNQLPQANAFHWGYHHSNVYFFTILLNTRLQVVCFVNTIHKWQGVALQIFHRYSIDAPQITLGCATSIAIINKN